MGPVAETRAGCSAARRECVIATSRVPEMYLLRGTEVSLVREIARVEGPNRRMACRLLILWRILFEAVGLGMRDGRLFSVNRVPETRAAWNGRQSVLWKPCLNAEHQIARVKPETATQVRECVTEIIALADQDVLDLMRSRANRK